MGNRFKFRAYLTELNKMVEPMAIRFIKTGTAIEYYDGEQKCLDTCNYYKLMQCTGLTDKNGTFIFEGDIVQSEGFTSMNKVINVVVWEEDNGYVRCGYTPLSDQFYDNGYAYSDFEIIGNIYENPELLKAVQND